MNNLRKIIHVDMDCFYAAVELRDNPHLKGKPVAIGGPPDSRSVLCTANYEARKYGVRAAISSALAVKLCPHLTILPPNFYKYKEVSGQIHEIFKEFTDLIEPLSLDEAYLDVTDNEEFGGLATPIAVEIKKRIFEKTGLTASAGVAPNKFLAKVASDWNKPDGLFIVAPQNIEKFVLKLPLEKISGVGKVTLEKLHQHHLKNCTDVLNIGEEYMGLHFGKMGRHIYKRSQGKDDRAVVTEYTRKSLSIENTFSADIEDDQLLLNQVNELIENWFSRLMTYKERKNPTSWPNKLFIKVKTWDFKTHTVEQIIPDSIISDIWEQETLSENTTSFFHQLYKESRQRNNEALRLIGLGCRFQTKTLESAPEKKDHRSQLNFLEIFDEMA
mgnify:CR=1 FL=1|tara:strand:- start:16907 stop:18064 length:1158 start_codon:yes stop_codon:yes gene_type:complete